MTARREGLRTRRDFLDAHGVLLVTRASPRPEPASARQPAAVASDPSEGLEILLSVWDDGEVIALHGHVDLGTGLRTALAQVVAEELDVAVDRVRLIMGDTARAPNQGATIASASIQIHALPLRQAAAQARGWLVGQAAGTLGVAVESLRVVDGVVQGPGSSIAYADLVAGERVHLQLSTDNPLKPVADYRVVGQSIPRVDIEAKATGEAIFVHDFRMPGMLHGRVVRPPYAGVDHGDFVGNTLEAVDEASIADIPGIRAVVVIRDFVGIVAEREEYAELAASQLRVRWKPCPVLPPLDDLAEALRANPSTRRRLVDDGDVEAAPVDQRLSRTYVWPYQLHASIGPSCAVADWQGDALTVWAGTQNPHALRADLAKLTGLADPAVEIVRMEAAGCYGRNGADDVAADAALLSRAVGAPVRVQLSREQEHLWEPKGAAQWMTVDGGLDADGAIAAWDFATSYPSNGAPTLALLLTRTIEPVPQVFEMGDRTARPPYEADNLRVTVNDMPPILRASWLRGVAALPNSFAHESYVDELAMAAGVDPVAFRLRHLKDERAAELLQATADRAGWIEHATPQGQGATGDVLHGQGVAYARYVHSAWPGFGSAWAAWVADVDVNRVTGEVHVKRVVVGHDAGLMINPAGVAHQIHGNVVQTTSRALEEEVTVDPSRQVVATREWGSYPIIGFRDVPVIEVMTMPRADQPPLGVGESASVPGTAAIANAIFDATGVRFRQPPFTPETIREGLGIVPPPPGEGRGGGASGARRAASPPSRPSPRAGRRAAAVALGVLATIAGLLGIRSSIAPVTRPDPAIYTAATLERGRQLAALGNCIGCHTTTGGLALETPFGTVYTTNLTPDIETGIGAWSFSAFQRAMREGISRDGHRLYPAFPYTAFTRTTDDDLMALYAWLMAQEPVRHEVPATRLAFPFGVRPLMAAWNGLFLESGAKPIADPARSSQWNRGAYLVEGLGHCGACHTERNALGAEKVGVPLAGAMVDGWDAPSLTASARAPVSWTEAAYFDYLRTGHSDRHGIAAGPMAQVIRGLAPVPDEDLHAMATYLASLNADAPRVQALVNTDLAPGRAQRMFESGCGACHHDGDGPHLLGQNTPLALATRLHSDRPDNLLRVILDGIREPAGRTIGFMPAFRDALDDSQIAELAGWMRARYAPEAPPWKDLEEAIARVRRQSIAAAPS